MQRNAKFVVVMAPLILLLASARLAPSQTSPAKPTAPAMSAKAVLDRAANALGGLDRVKSVKNITLVGYAHYAYMNGGGNITASIYAPQKYIAANDLRRLYDLEHDRYQQLERRNDLFPFAAVNGHDYALVNQVLDGSIGYNVAQNGNARRAPDGDGIRLRRMAMMMNPVVLVRTAMDPGTTVSNLRKDGEDYAMDLKLKQGYKLSMGLSQQRGLPLWVRWFQGDIDLGEITLTTHFTGYQYYGGLWMPLGYLTLLDWRHVELTKIWVDTYLVDGKIADLTAPASVQTPVTPPTPQPVTVVPVAKGIWRLSNGTTVVEFSDHLTIFELDANAQVAVAALDKARSLVPGKPITQMIVSHHHFDHTSGRPHVRIAHGGIAEPHHHLAARQRRNFPRNDFTTSAGFSRRTREKSQAAEIYSGGRSLAPAG